MSDTIEKVSIIISKGSLEGIYPGLIRAQGSRAEGIEANLFFTFFGLDAIHKARNEHIKLATVGNPGLHFATMAGGLPGVSTVMTHYMNHKMEKLDIRSDFIETLIGDPALCRLYLAFAKLDRETAESLRKTVSFTRLKTYAHVLDFYGGMFAIRGGKAVTPGGARSESAWAELAGAPPAQGPQFFDKLIAKDDGWLASLYDALARIHGPVEEYLTDPARIKRFYAAIRGRVTSPGPARPVLRANADMMLLTTRLRLDPSGRPHIPGNLEIWKNLFAKSTLGKYDIRLSRQAPAWKDPDDLVEALFALCRKNVENQPLKIFMAISEVDRNRAAPVEPAR